MISESEKAKMLKVPQIGPKMVAFLEDIGIEKLADLRGADADELAIRINLQLGFKHINKMGVRALEALIKAAEA